ncbi:hypothetical protein C7U61_03235 [Rhizobium sp. JAB6]|nr:hypothetical protein C7U61_03235 [Rhizobium sp. JAB6]
MPQSSNACKPSKRLRPSNISKYSTNAPAETWLVLLDNRLTAYSRFAFLRIAKMLYLFVFTQLRTENRSALFLELL